MAFTQTGLPGLLVYEPKVFTDDRGYFFESYSERSFRDAGIHIRFVQDNQARSTYGVLRGLHYQLDPHAQTKLIRVLEGEIVDVVVDLRAGSPTQGKNFTIRLSAENKKQLLVPRGFAHGYAVVSPHAEVYYKVDEFYHKASEGGLLFRDPSLGIDWGIDPARALVSDKDRVLPLLGELGFPFRYEYPH